MLCQTVHELHTLQVVDEDGSLGWSPTYAYPHYEAAGTFDFVLLTTDTGAQVRC